MSFYKCTYNISAPCKEFLMDIMFMTLPTTQHCPALISHTHIHKQPYQPPHTPSSLHAIPPRTHAHIHTHPAKHKHTDTPTPNHHTDMCARAHLQLHMYIGHRHLHTQKHTHMHTNTHKPVILI